MNTPKQVFETGATSAAVNELILYTDNTRELAELRDEFYAEKMLFRPNISFRPLQFKALCRYEIETKQRLDMNEDQIDEYCQIYANRFPEWKRERERNPQ